LPAARSIYAVTFPAPPSLPGGRRTVASKIDQDGLRAFAVCAQCHAPRHANPAHKIVQAPVLGILVLVVVPIVVVLLSVTVIGVPLALIVLALYVLLMPLV